MEATKPKALKAAASVKKASPKSPATPVKAVTKHAVKPAALETKRAAKPTKDTTKKSKKEHKVKVVRDSFTMPQNEYLKIAEIKSASLKAGLPVKKSEVLRAGLQVLAALTPAQMQRVLTGLEKIKTGRPKSAKKSL